MGQLVASKKTQATATAAVTSKLTGTIGGMIDQLHALRERKRELQAEIDKVEGEYSGVEEQLMEKLAAEGVDASKGKVASCSITKTTVAEVKDWDEVFKYVKKTGHFHLFQRRITDGAYREILESGKKVPGIEPFVKKRLNLRVLAG